MDPLTTEALRIYRRYQLEVVEGFGFCPWAAHAREEGRVKPLVMPAPVFDLDEELAAVRRMAEDPDVDIGLLIHPRLEVTREEWGRLVRELGNADDARWPTGEVPLAMAAFHPDAAADLGDPARLVPFIRRSPDPTIQLVRLETLRRLRGREQAGTGYVDPAMLARGELPELITRVPLHERVASDNRDKVREVGVEHVEAVLADIRADRDRSYARVSRSASASVEPWGRPPGDADAGGAERGRSDS